MINQTLSIRCEASGIPQPQITWHFDGVPFATAHGEALAALDDIERKYEMGEGSAEFRIQNVSREHQGRYSCLAVNKAGRAEADIFVQIMGEHLDLTQDFFRRLRHAAKTPINIQNFRAPSTPHSNIPCSSYRRKRAVAEL